MYAKTNLGHPPNQFTTNSTASYHLVLKDFVGRQGNNLLEFLQKIQKLFKDQTDELCKALYQGREYRLSDPFNENGVHDENETGSR